MTAASATALSTGVSAACPAEPTNESTAGVAANVAEIVRLEQRDRLAMSRTDHISNWLAAFSGRIAFAGLHAAFFAVWIVWNAGWLPVAPFDAYPFGLLTVIVSLEAIFLSTFVLISQNQQARLADRRAKVDLQINVLTEQETTRILTIVTELSRRFDLLATRDIDPAESHPLEQQTILTEVMDTIDAVEAESDPAGAAGPDSAADTDA
jgi:uncharacterized membrane protein